MQLSQRGFVISKLQSVESLLFGLLQSASAFCNPWSTLRDSCVETLDMSPMTELFSNCHCQGERQFFITGAHRLRICGLQGLESIASPWYAIWPSTQLFNVGQERVNFTAGLHWWESGTQLSRPFFQRGYRRMRWQSWNTCPQPWAQMLMNKKHYWGIDRSGWQAVLFKRETTINPVGLPLWCVCLGLFAPPPSWKHSLYCCCICPWPSCSGIFGIHGRPASLRALEWNNGQ